MGKYEELKKEIPIHGRRGNIKLGSVMERDFFGWDSFSLRYALVDGCGMIPEETEKQHVHAYDQVLWFLSADADDMLNLGAEIEVDLGEKGIRHNIAVPHTVVIPKGTPHFSPIVKKLDKPFFFVSVNLTGELKAYLADGDTQPQTGPWARFFGEFSANVRGIAFEPNDPYHYGSELAQPSGGYTAHVGSDVVKIPVSMAWSTVCQPHDLGPYGPDGKHRGHTHQDFDEALIFLSMDLDNLTDLHCVADYCVGEEGKDQEHYLLTKATVMAMKKGTCHLPLTYTEVTGPSVFITLGTH